MTARAAADRPRILAHLAENPGQTAYEVAAALGYGKPQTTVSPSWSSGCIRQVSSSPVSSSGR